MLKFHGTRLVDGKSGLIVEPDESGNQVHILDSRNGFRLTVPYSESWQVQAQKTIPLLATDDDFEISVLRRLAQPRGVRNYLSALLEHPPLTAGGIEYVFLDQPAILFRVQHSQLLQIRETIIAAYQMRVLNPPLPVNNRYEWRWYCWTIDEQDGTWLVLHVSALVSDEENGGLPQAIQGILSSFRSMEITPREIEFEVQPRE